jgi:chemotaxis protein histidine kinase CheA
VLGGVLAHLVRNAIAHGIEPVAERASLGKAAVGSIELACRSAGAESAVLSVADDGRGVAGNSLLERAQQTREPLRGLSASSRSSRRQATELAGRGVGLSAVEADLERVGYALRVEPRGGGGTCFEIRPRGEQRA